MATWEAPINPTHTTASMTTATGVVLAANKARRYALIVNDGAADVYINLGEAAVANTGILINADGGSYEISPAQGNLFLGAINGITALGTATLLITEGT